MNKKINIIILLLLSHLLITAQTAPADSLIWRLTTPYVRPSTSDFDILCDYLINTPDSIKKYQVLNNPYFAETISTQIDSTKNLYRVYTERRDKESLCCNGFYWISQNDSRYSAVKAIYLFGVNFELLSNNLWRVTSDRKFTNIIGGFKEGVPECLWKYEIANITDKTTIFKYENYHNGLLHGDYTITTSRKDSVFSNYSNRYIEIAIPQDTIYHTTFDNGTGYYVDYYPNGGRQLEGYVRNGQPEGKWLFYIRNSDNELERIELQIKQEEKSIE